jgi:hypothetical protein
MVNTSLCAEPLPTARLKRRRAGASEGLGCAGDASQDGLVARRVQGIRHQCGDILESGQIVLQGPGADLARNDAVRKAYLGIV